MNQTKLSDLIFSILRAGYFQHFPPAMGTTKIDEFCRERANNIAQAMPELLAECEKKCTCMYNFGDGVHASTRDARVGGILGTSIEGVEAGDSEDEDDPEPPMRWYWQNGVLVRE